MLSPFLFSGSSDTTRKTQTLISQLTDHRKIARPGCHLLWVLVLVAESQASQPATIQLQVFTKAGAPLTAPQDWIEVLTESGFSKVRIRSFREGDAISVSRHLSRNFSTYHVTGIITRRNSLRLPNAVFTLRDQQKIRNWIKRLKTDGGIGPRQQPVAFGLSSKELVHLRKQLARTVNSSTKGQTTDQVLRAIRKQLVFPLHFNPASKNHYRASFAVDDELSEFSVGTALSVTLRPLGLVWYPKAVDEEIELIVTDIQRAEEFWPVGWPVKHKSSQAVPKLMEPLRVKIKNQPLGKVLQILSMRMQTPFLLDHHALARHRIDPDSTRVSIPEGQSYYKRVLDGVLGQSMLINEVRQDESGMRFFWISSLKQ